EKYERWFAILFAVLTKDVSPNVFSFPEHNGHKLFELIFFWVSLSRTLRGWWRSVVGHLLKQLSRVSAKQQGDNDDDEGSNPPAYRNPASTREASTVFNVVAFPFTSPTHNAPPRNVDDAALLHRVEKFRKKCPICFSLSPY